MLQRVASGGATVCLATSRRWVGAYPVAEELGLECPLILYDGAITLAGQRSSTVAALIADIGATNQLKDDITSLMLGKAARSQAQ